MSLENMCWLVFRKVGNYWWPIFVSHQFQWKFWANRFSDSLNFESLLANAIMYHRVTLSFFFSVAFFYFVCLVKMSLCFLHICCFLCMKFFLFHLEQEDGVEISANSLHPGTITTNLFRHMPVNGNYHIVLFISYLGIV